MVGIAVATITESRVETTMQKANPRKQAIICRNGSRFVWSVSCTVWRRELRSEVNPNEVWSPCSSKESRGEDFVGTAVEEGISSIGRKGEDHTVRGTSYMGFRMTCFSQIMRTISNTWDSHADTKNICFYFQLVIQSRLQIARGAYRKQ